MPSSSALDRALRAHCDALSACRACGVAEVVGAEVLPIVSLARRPRVMLVGQAPGKTEITAQRPFAGRAGKTLFRWMERAGVDEATVRERIYIAAITRCYPGPSPSGRGDRVPTPREQAQCAPWLEAELSIIRPAVVVPVGRLAITRFVGNRPLDELIGEEHVVRHAGGESIAIPLPHPSGASSWIHERGHAALLDRALARLQLRLAESLYS
jgi:uracil-DNA glycosylase